MRFLARLLSTFALTMVVAFSSTAMVAAAASSDPAAGLARQVHGARSATTRAAAILNILRALHIGVYNGNGRPIVRGAERSARDFYLYDFEAKTIADGLAQRQTHDVSDVATLLAKVGAAPVSGGDLAAVLKGGIRAAARKPTTPSSLVPLLIRDLGRDDGRPVTQLDALQYFLLQASFLGGSLRAESAGGHGAPTTHGAGDGPCPVVEPPAGNRSIGEAVLDWWVSREIGGGGVGTRIAKSLQVKDLVDKLLGGFHGGAIALGLDVRAVDTNLYTHYGPENAGLGPDAGKPIDFRVQVTMRDDLGEEKINCLALAGIKLPRKGPVQGVEFVWDRGNQLVTHGTTVLKNGGHTDGEGIATMTFVPKDELIPGLGVDTHDTGVAVGYALWQRAFGDVGGLFGINWNQWITPKFDGIRWDVGYHNQNATLKFNSSVGYQWNSTIPGYLIDTGASHYGMQAQVPITNGTGGSAPMSWTSFSYSEEKDYPQGDGQCAGASAKDLITGRDPVSGTLSVQSITGPPNIAVTVGIGPAAYTTRDTHTSTSGCGAGTTDGGSSYYGGLAEAFGSNARSYTITGWTPGGPRSGVFATKTVQLPTGTVTLKIVPRF